MGAGGNSVKIGSILSDRYELIQVIANGGMAQVWIGTDLESNESVAIKVLHPHLAEDEKFCSRFIREAEAAAALSHPSIVAIHDSISDDGVYAIVMDYIEGNNLRDHLDKHKTLSVEEATRFGYEIAEALDVAHSAGIVHRDIKPANIMIREDECAVITDFGIAKATSDKDLTATGMLLGTAKYLSPEQVTGDQTDGRSDLYSLAVVMYESLGGIAPFVAENEAATALLRLQRPAPLLSEVAPELENKQLDSFLKKALSKQADDRFQTAGEFTNALEKLDNTGTLKPRSLDSTVEGDEAEPSEVSVAKTDLTASPNDDIVEIESKNQSGLLVLTVGGALLFGALVFAIIMLLGSLRDLNTSGNEDSTAQVANFIVRSNGETVEDTEADLSFDNDEETSWVVEDLEQVTLILEVEPTSDLSQATILASPSETVFTINFYREDSVVTAPIATLDLAANDSAELDLSSITFISVEFERSTDDDPTALREIQVL